MDDLIVVGYPVGVVIVALVEAIKRLTGIQGKAATGISVAVGVVLVTAARAAAIWPGFGSWWEVVLTGVLLGLAACGMFDAGRLIRPERK